MTRHAREVTAAAKRAAVAIAVARCCCLVKPLLLRGTGGQMRRSIVSGDVTEGEFHFDESEDGVDMAAVWNGVAENCGGRLTITGTRRPATGADSPDPELRFRLTKPSGWR